MDLRFLNPSTAFFHPNLLCDWSIMNLYSLHGPMNLIHILGRQKGRRLFQGWTSYFLIAVFASATSHYIATEQFVVECNLVHLLKYCFEVLVLEYFSFCYCISTLLHFGGDYLTFYSCFHYTYLKVLVTLDY